MTTYLEIVKKKGKQEEYISFMYGMGVPATEIAAMFNVTRQAVYANIHRYKERLGTADEERKLLS